VKKSCLNWPVAYPASLRTAQADEWQNQPGADLLILFLLHNKTKPYTR